MDPENALKKETATPDNGRLLACLVAASLIGALVWCATRQVMPALGAWAAVLVLPRPQAYLIPALYPLALLGSRFVPAPLIEIALVTQAGLAAIGAYQLYSSPKRVLPLPDFLDKGVGLIGYAVLFSCFLKSADLSLSAAWACTVLLPWYGGRRGRAVRMTVRFGANVALVALGCLLAGAILEVGSRMVFEYTPRRFLLFEPRPGYLYGLRPGFNEPLRIALYPDRPAAYIPAQVSNQGFRNPEIGAKAADEYRILLAGDSFTFGWGMPREESLAPLLEERLQERFPNRPVTVINAGAPGYAPWTAHGLFLDQGLRFAPDLVVLQVFTGNDLADTLAQTDTPMDALEVNRAYRLNLVQRFKLHHDYRRIRFENGLLGNSYFYHHLWRESTHDLHLSRVLNALRFLPTIPIHTVPESAARPFGYEPDLATWYPKLEESWRRFTNDILAFHEACIRRDIAFGVYNIPYPFSWDVGKTHLREYPQGLYDPDKANRKIEQFFQDAELPFREMLAPFRNHPAPESLYFTVNEHLNQEGTHFLADLLAEWIAREMEGHRMDTPVSGAFPETLFE